MVLQQLNWHALQLSVAVAARCQQQTAACLNFLALYSLLLLDRSAASSALCPGRAGEMRCISMSWRVSPAVARSASTCPHQISAAIDIQRTAVLQLQKKTQVQGSSAVLNS